MADQISHQKHEQNVQAGHLPVLLNEVEALLSLNEITTPITLLDGTLGRGGHAAHLIPMLPRESTYIGLDLDPGNAHFARQRLASLAHHAGIKLIIKHGNFADSPKLLREEGISKVDRLLADIGFASNQMDDGERGFAIEADGPLDMRLNTREKQSAADLVNRTPERELADLIYEYGEEKKSRQIAKAIVTERKQSKITTTGRLKAVIEAAVPAPPKRTNQRAKTIHPATRTFMALRIAVNRELDNLDALLDATPALLNKDGRALIISFHSLEDRKVKQAFHHWEKDDLGKRLTKKPVIATDDEVHKNPRSRSAKMRGFHKQTERDEVRPLIDPGIYH